jgi:hypothetical protein
MRTDRVASENGAVAARPDRFTLEVDSVEDPISGRVSDGRGTTRSFIGWLGFANALQSALSEASSRAALARSRDEEPKSGAKPYDSSGCARHHAV